MFFLNITVNVKNVKYVKSETVKDLILKNGSVLKSASFSKKNH